MLLADSLALHQESQPALADAFLLHQDSILAAAWEQISKDPDYANIVKDPARLRLIRETARILVENLAMTMKYQLPEITLEYLRWLRPYLLSRGIRPHTLVRLLRTIHIASVGFMPLDHTDAISHILRALRRQEEQDLEVSP